MTVKDAKGVARMAPRFVRTEDAQHLNAHSQRDRWFWSWGGAGRDRRFGAGREFLIRRRRRTKDTSRRRGASDIHNGLNIGIAQDGYKLFKCSDGVTNREYGFIIGSAVTR
jgi:hypothetical protein